MRDGYSFRGKFNYISSYRLLVAGGSDEIIRCAYIMGDSELDFCYLVDGSGIYWPVSNKAPLVGVELHGPIYIAGIAKPANSPAGTGLGQEGDKLIAQLHVMARPCVPDRLPFARPPMQWEASGDFSEADEDPIIEAPVAGRNRFAVIAKATDTSNTPGLVIKGRYYSTEQDNEAIEFTLDDGTDFPDDDVLDFDFGPTPIHEIVVEANNGSEGVDTFTGTVIVIAWD